MQRYLQQLIPPLTKTVLKIFIGSEAADLGGSALTVAIRYFGDKGEAHRAADKAKAIAAAICRDMESWLSDEKAPKLSSEFYTSEIADALDIGFSERAVIEAIYDPKLLAESIFDKKRDDWRIHGV